MNALSMLVFLLCALSAPVTTDAVADDEQSAQQLLDLAAHFQRGDVPRQAPHSFHGRFYATVRNPESGDSGNATLERWYLRDPERMLTHRTDKVVDTDSTQGFDGTRVWARDEKSGDVVVLSERPDVFEADLDLVAYQLRLTRLLVDMAMIDALVPELQNPRRLSGTVRVRDALEGRTHEAAKVTAYVVDELFGPDPDGPPLMPGDPDPRLKLTFDIDVATGALWGLHLVTVDRARPIEIEITIGGYRPNRQGLMVPANLRVYENGRSGEEYSLQLGVNPLEVEGPDGPQEIVEFDIDVPIDPKLFEVPASSEDR